MRLKKNNFDLQFALLCFVRYSTLKKINQDVHYRMTEKLQSYYLSKVEPFRSCLLALREIILDHNPKTPKPQIIELLLV